MSFSCWSLSAFLLVAACVFWTTAEAQDVPNTFPNGLFCEPICQGELSEGSAFHCLFNRKGKTNKFIVRQNFAANSSVPWQFYHVNSNTKPEDICNITIAGDAFLQTGSNNACAKTRNAMRNFNFGGSGFRFNNNNNMMAKKRSYSQNTRSVNQNQNQLQIGYTHSAIWYFLRGIIKVVEMVENITNHFFHAENGSLQAQVMDEEFKLIIMNMQLAIKHAVFKPEILCQIVTMDLCSNQRMIRCEASGNCCQNQVNSPLCSDNHRTSMVFQQCLKDLDAILMPN